MYKIKVQKRTLDTFMRDFPKHFERASRDATREIATNIRSEMQVIAPARNENDPVNWDSTKQKIAFFATDGFGEGVPHVRQGRYPNFEVTALPMGYGISAKSPAGAIGGTIGASSPTISELSQLESWQSAIHKGHWKPLLPVVRKQIGDLAKTIFEKLKNLVRDD